MQDRQCSTKECANSLSKRQKTGHCSQMCRLLAKYELSTTEFRQLVVEARSWNDLSKKTNPSHTEAPSSTYKRVRRLVEMLDVDVQHFVGQGWNAGNVYSKKTLANQLGNPDAKSGTLKMLLIAEGVKEAKCERPGCGLSEWFGRPAALELEHVDGDVRNNTLENLRIYCLQCHAQTPTWRRSKSSLAGVVLLPEWERNEPV